MTDFALTCSIEHDFTVTMSKAQMSAHSEKADSAPMLRSAAITLIKRNRDGAPLSGNGIMVHRRGIGSAWLQPHRDTPQTVRSAEVRRARSVDSCREMRRCNLL